MTQVQLTADDLRNALAFINRAVTTLKDIPELEVYQNLRNKLIAAINELTVLSPEAPA